MKSLLALVLLAASTSAFALQIQNPDGSTSYVSRDPSGEIRVDNDTDGSTSYVSRDPSGAIRIDNNRDGSTSYITNGLDGL